MDPYKLLSRSTRVRRATTTKRQATVPSDGSSVAAALKPLDDGDSQGPPEVSRKRKRGSQAAAESIPDTSGIDFFDGATRGTESESAQVQDGGVKIGGQEALEENGDVPSGLVQMSQDDCRSILGANKVKISWLNVFADRDGSQGQVKRKREAGPGQKPQFLYPRPLQSFDDLDVNYKVAKTLKNNVRDQGYTSPTEVQLAALPLLLGQPVSSSTDVAQHPVLKVTTPDSIDLLTVAPTGSGKTLAFMIPLIQNVMRIKHSVPKTSRRNLAIILSPTKELVAQTVNEGRKLAKSTGVQITQVRKGMHLGSGVSQPQEENSRDLQDQSEPSDISVKADILVSTPGLLHSIVAENKTSGWDALSSIRYMVLDEADVLLDPLFRDQTLATWNALPNPSLRVSLWSATMGSNIEELARSVISSRRNRLAVEHEAGAEAPLIRLVVGLKDSAVPNVQHRLVYAATEQGKLMGLRQLIHPALSSAEAGPPLRPPFLVFTQTIERAVALHSELLYDIPVEAGGISRIAVLHSDLSDTARDNVMTRFRKGEIWILITTDLLSRGVDFRGMNGVVNYDIPTSSAAYIHRVGRTGRAGREGGVAVTLYSKEDVPFLKPVANVVSIAQNQKGAGAATGAEGLQQWLLDALPTLSKQDKHKLKKHGVESRTARGRKSDPKAARKARISTKSGYLRKAENNRKGAVLGSQRRLQEGAVDNADEGSDFEGFG